MRVDRFFKSHAFVSALALSVASTALTASANPPKYNFPEPQQGLPESDYFARFKYTVDEALALLKQAEGKPLKETEAAWQLLDDMGYWKTTRGSTAGPFKLSGQLEKQLQAQFKYLERAFRYDAGDVVWVPAQAKDEMPYGVAKVNHRARIVKSITENDTEFFVVETLDDGPSQMENRQGTLYDGKKGTINYYKDTYQHRTVQRVFTRAELDRLNSPTTSKPVDQLGEKLDWSKDEIWRAKLASFKDQMARKNFEIDWTASPEQIEARQKTLMKSIFGFFKMNRNAASKSGQGIGLRCSGGGVCFDQALVLTFAVQGVGTPSGLKAMNLNGTTVNPQGGHGFVRVDIKGNPQSVIYDQVVSYDYLEKNGWSDSIPKREVKFAGTEWKVNNFVGISDPGWADYGVTPDYFSLMDVGDSLNPFPLNANRAVLGVASHRTLSEVSGELGAKGPLAVYKPQRVAVLNDAARKAMLEAFAKHQDDASLRKELRSVLQAQGYLADGKPQLHCPGAFSVISFGF